jgi:hypothetical protein
MLSHQLMYQLLFLLLLVECLQTMVILIFENPPKDVTDDLHEDL